MKIDRDGKDMIKKVKLLGMEIDNYTVREAMLQVEVFLDNNVLNTIENISTKVLVAAEQTESVRECMEQLDLAIIAEKGILTAAGITSAQRIREIKDQDFFQEFMKRIIRNHKSVFLLGAKREKIEGFQQMLNERYPQLKIVGMSAMQECVGDIDAVINEMNAMAPDVIFSILPTPEQEQFLLEKKDRLNAKIWYGLGEDLSGIAKRESFWSILQHVIHKRRLQSKNNKYDEGT